jgi:hypothetical protein
MEPLELIILIASAAVSVVIGIIIGITIRKRVAERTIGSAEVEATRLINEAIRGGENKKKEMLLEAKDGDDNMKIYGVVDEDGGKVSDFILHTPSDCAVICILGSISTEAIAKLALDD